MARKKGIEEDALKKLINRYLSDELNGDATKLSFAGIGRFVRANGYSSVQDKSIRDKEEIVKYVYSLKESIHNKDEEAMSNLAVFKSINEDDFLRKNSTPSKLKAALVEKDEYYRKVCENAGIIFANNKALIKENALLKEKIKELEKTLEKGSADTKAVSELRKKVKAYKDIVNTYVYPEVANELLRKNGLLENTAGIVDSNIVDANLVTPETDVSKIKNKVIKGLFEKVNE